MTSREAVRKSHRQATGWHTLFSAALLVSAIAGCKSQQTQSQPPAVPSMPSASSPSQPQSQSSSPSTSRSQSPNQPQTAGSGQPRSSSSSQPGAKSPAADTTSRRDTQTAASSGEQSSRTRPVEDNLPTPDSRSRSPSSPIYSDSDQVPQDRTMPPDPSSGEQGSPPENIDFSEEEQSASSASASSSSASPSSTSSSAASSSSATSGQSPAGAARTGSAPNEMPTSAAERVAELEGRFESTMVSYDGMILRERDYVRNKPGSASAETGEEAMDEPPAGESLEDLIESAEAEIPAPPGGNNSADGGPQQNNSSGQITGPGLPASGRQGDYNHRNTQAVVPADIPSGTDDDVVARQIREAATRETDPELREKLWEEYRKYKSATK
ncbi:hypothetical protein ACL7TT_11925 [Microbulbifer sp. 2304DJ12-6]|uniref:hypothetical protein n=1 Tax=Microbulbifer sp. 2304DJ12-6 TaxID=3233340 RepID=UPI0039B0C71D